MAKKNKNVTNWRNDKKDFRAFFEDNKKFLMPAILVIAVGITVAVALSANRRSAVEVMDAAVEADPTAFVVPEVTMEENAYPKVNALVEKYYDALAKGDADTLSQIYIGLDETEVLKAVAASEYIDSYENITVYTKPGPKDESFVAYIYNEVKLYDYDKNVPGLETLYICMDDNTEELYINGDIADAKEIDYLREINIQADVIDLNNKVASSYNEMVSADEELAELLTKMRLGLQVSVGEALATNEGTAEENTDNTASESEEQQEETITTRVIKATDVINIRSSDSETADVLDKTEKGQEFKELEALANGWSKVEYKDGVAYVKTEFFDVVSNETTKVPKDTAENTDEQAEGGDDDNSDTSTAKADEDGENETSSTADNKTDNKADNNTDNKTDNKSDNKTDSSASASNKVSSDSKSGKMKVTDSVKFRKEASTESDALATLYAGTSVNVVEQYTNGWSKVEYNNKTGYIKSEFLQ